MWRLFKHIYYIDYWKWVLPNWPHIVWLLQDPFISRGEFFSPKEMMGINIKYENPIEDMMINKLLLFYYVKFNIFRNLGFRYEFIYYYYYFIIVWKFVRTFRNLDMKDIIFIFYYYIILGFSFSSINRNSSILFLLCCPTTSKKVFEILGWKWENKREEQWESTLWRREHEEK